MDQRPPSRSPSAPFIVTAELPRDIFAWANSLRSAHFPRERNWLKAHVTLFHSFAPSLRAELPRLLARVAADYAAPRAEIDGLMDLGSGTAIAIRSPAMLEIRDRIAEYFWDMLTQQDQGGKRLHITVQNKVSQDAARALQKALSAHIAPRRFAFRGLGLHTYLGPQWETLGTWSFHGKQGA